MFGQEDVHRRSTEKLTFVTSTLLAFTTARVGDLLVTATDSPGLEAVKMVHAKQLPLEMSETLLTPIMYVSLEQRPLGIIMG